MTLPARRINRFPAFSEVELQRLARDVADVYSQPILDGHLIENLQLTSGEPLVVNHGLARRIRGYFITRKSAAADIFDTNTTNLLIFFSATQSPRVFADQRDSGWKNGKWDEGKMPKNHLRFSEEVTQYNLLLPSLRQQPLKNHVLSLTNETVDG